MTKTKTSTTSEMAALASEICDMWQEHLATLSADPAAKADFMRMAEPQRQAFSALFADYTAMMQHAPHAKHSAEQSQQSTHAAPDATTGTVRSAPAAAASDDGALRMAQLAHRLATLEERVGKLESRATGRARKTAGKSGDTES